ncbi:sensor domain-containing diguanylate cyclase [Roseomonas sp. SSH11]|uniref:diguanylate cyclase n=1 Tax=Pararoseomonas baculiformis TaxID=2820812 RepID=A0ABS4A8B9_9PROT|nr:sensor domain-containing diguanylate cyclase [Pararoseomonas baculiformis]MBP0443242.1 sensor domain-containing diguanylate cyclase [Pararoseomonas baculiformis]
MSPAVAARWLMLTGMALALGMLALGTVVLLQARDVAWEQAKQASSNLVTALERDIARNIATIDLSLDGVIAALQEPGIDQITPELRHKAMFDRATTAEHLGAVLVLDAEGRVAASSNGSASEGVILADRDYFRTHQHQPNAGLYVGHPFRSRLRNGDPSVSVSRRLPSPDGQFQGVVMAALRIAYFADLFDRLDLGAKGSVALLRTDGPLIARAPFNPADIGRDLSRGEVFRQILGGGPAGTFVATSTLDGVERFYTYRRIGSLPLVLSLGVSVEEIYDAWWRKAYAMGSILVVLCAAIAALSFLFRRAILGRIAAEDALRQAAEELSVMAATDGLTGLANRRHFDARLDEEWRRAIRGSTTLSLLLLDADCFKAFNDRYGHLEGDEVLVGIARSIRRCVRRPADAGARYGGEEFVVLLPETDAAGARTIGEAIRAAVEALDIPHADTPFGHVTVSIGWSCCYPQPGQAPALLITEADRALYAAKRGGRNRVAGQMAGLAAA